MLNPVRSCKSDLVLGVSYTGVEYSSTDSCVT